MAITFKPQQTLERPLTVEDYESFPDDGNRYEIIGGELIVSPSPPLQHQRVLGKLATALDAHLTNITIGEIIMGPLDVHFSIYDVVQPDLLVVLNENREIIHEHGIVGAPDLIIEIVSPSSEFTDRVPKTALYASNQVKEYWIVDPVEETVTVHLYYVDRFSPSVDLRRDFGMYSRVLGGFVLQLSQIFPKTEAKSTETTHDGTNSTSDE